jgi:multidrug efflux pump subunit AcrB
VVAAVRSENQDLPLGAIRSREQERVVQIDARMQRPEDFGKIIVARRNGAPGARGPGGRRESTARRRSTAWRCTTASAPCC